VGNHDSYSDFLPCFLRGTYAQGAWVPAAAFAGEPKEIAFVLADFFGGTATRRDGEAGSRACVRKAHRYSRACRAREKKERQKREVIEVIKLDSRERKSRSLRDPGANRL
jgi:hypothetical protein